MENDKSLDNLIHDMISEDNGSSDKVYTAKEIAQTELFGIIPTINMDEINKNMSKGKEEELKEKYESELNKKAHHAKATVNPNQESIDFSPANIAFFNTEQTDNERNYRKRLGKLIKHTNVETTPFVVETKAEGEMPVVVMSKENDIPLPFQDFEEGVEDKDDSNIFNAVSKRTFTPLTAIDDTVNFIFLNKCIFATLLIVCAICLLETAVMYFVINQISPIPPVFYFIALLLSFIPLGIGVFKYAFNPNYKVRKKFNYVSMFLNSFIVVVVLMVLLLIIVLLSSISLTDPTDYVPKIVLPALFILNFPVGVLTFMLLSKSKLFYVKKYL